MNTYFKTTLLSVVVFAIGCNQVKEQKATNMADAIYIGGDIITMEGDSATYIEAVAVKDGLILYAGSKVECEKFVGEGTVIKDLMGKTLVPGFIDGHAHFFMFGAQAITANLLATPDGNISTIDDLANELKDWYAKNGTTRTNGWIVGMGFDDANLSEKRFPTKYDLDKVSKDVPIMITHISGHFAVVNSKGLKILGITASTPDPAGGVIRHVQTSKEPNGVLEELAAIPYMMKVLSPSTSHLTDLYLDEGQKMAVRYGYTTCNEGRAMNNHEQMADYAKRGKFFIDVNSWIDYAFMKYMHTEWNSKTYKNHYRIAGLKLTLDGSPQGRTAWRTIPYLIPPDGQQKGYRGYPAISNDEVVQSIVDSAFANNWQLKTHCNADAAADQLFRAVNNASTKYGNNNRRNILIHGQLIRLDQLDSLNKYEIIGSFFPMHTFYWGDWYKEIIGVDKANQISPVKSALRKGVKITTHTDAPVALPNLMMIVHTAVNRTSRAGSVMGAEEKLTPYEALQSITIWGAYQFFEDAKKGSFVAGKLADMVVLDYNPLKVDPTKIKEIKVLETIKEGQTVYQYK